MYDKDKTDSYVGSSVNDWLKEEGIFEEVQFIAIKEVIAWQLMQEMKNQSLSKVRMAKLLHTSRAQLDRLLDPKKDVTLSTLQKAATLMGKKLLVDLQ